ncbi:hypothetical protein BJ165DRAFT_1521346 [Panaeolus papilionaceus]|nr:hypothetical protein BJ165DRAFT_1521346 [Panaeolus papilionaceus]
MNTSNTASQAATLSWAQLRSALARGMAKTHPITYGATTQPSVMEASNLANIAIGRYEGARVEQFTSNTPRGLYPDSDGLFIRRTDKNGKTIPVKRGHLDWGTMFYIMASLVEYWGKDDQLLDLSYDDDEENTMAHWMCYHSWTSVHPLRTILDFLRLYFIGQLLDSAGEDVMNQFKSVVDNIVNVDICDSPHRYSQSAAEFNLKIVGVRRVARDELLRRRRICEEYDVVTFIDFKKWSLASYTGSGSVSVTELIDAAATEERRLLQGEWLAKSLGSDSESSTMMKTAHATVAQAFEPLAGFREEYKLPKGARVIVTGIYGHHYEASFNQQEKTLQWSTNLASQRLRDAATNNEYRNTIGVNEDILDLFFNALFDDLAKAIERWKNPTPAPDSTTSAESSLTLSLFKTVRTMLPGSFVPLGMTFRLTSVVLSDVMDPLSVETSWPRLPIGPLYLDLKLLWAENNVVWEDTERGIIFKQYSTADQYNNELGFYRRLAHLSWIPTMLGTVSTVGRWGIFTSFAGRPIQEDEWKEAVPALKHWVKELHTLGIHHHDLACRNVLKGPDGSFTIIDFDTAVESAQCDLSECPDLEVDYPLE